jgi:hypothetical protein
MAYFTHAGPGFDATGVRLSVRSTSQSLGDYAAAAESCAGELDRALALAVLIGTDLPSTATDPLRRWEALATMAAVDVSVARSVEAHLHGVEILDAIEANAPGSLSLIRTAVRADATSAWAVWVAETADPRVVAKQTKDGWRLVGVQPWCHLAGRVTHALVDAYVDGWRRALFAVDLRGRYSITMGSTDQHDAHDEWPRHDVVFDAVPAFPVSPAGWPDLRRAGDWHGIATAACWYGEAVGSTRRLLLDSSADPADPAAHVHLAAIDVDLSVARAALLAAASAITAAGTHSPRGGEAGNEGGDPDDDRVLVALRTRVAVGAAVERILGRLGRSTQPTSRASWDLSELGSRITNDAQASWEA